jgi:hypothetical protein
MMFHPALAKVFQKSPQRAEGQGFLADDDIFSPEKV